jgi:DNA polymerase sigma
MLEQVRNVEKKLESVRKERETAISILESIIKQTYNNNSNQDGFSRGGFYVGVKMYGSMATKLAIEQSDVDLAVVGLNF